MPVFPPLTSGGVDVDSIINSDGTLTISPTTGAVVASLNTAHSNTWTANQIMFENTSLIFRDATTQIYSGAAGELVLTSTDTVQTAFGDSTKFINFKSVGTNMKIFPGYLFGASTLSLADSSEVNVLTITTALATITGALSITANSNQIILDSDGTFTTTLTATASGSSKTITFPDSTTTLGGLATSQTWTGTNKINVNSTTAFWVEQDGVNDNTFIVDTTNAAVSVNQAIDTTSTFAVTETTKAQAIRTIQSYATRTNLSAINSAISLDWTTGNGANINGMIFNITDNHITTGGSGNNIRGQNFTITRTSTFATTRTTDNLYANILFISDSGNYNAVTNCTAVVRGLNSQVVFSPTTNPASGTPTLTYSGYGVEVVLSGTPVVTAGALTYNIYGTSVDMVASGSAGTRTGYAYYVKGVSGYNTNWAYYNSTAVSNLMGIDNGKSYFGTGSDVFIQYTGSIWDFDIAVATTSIDFNRSLFDTDFNVWGNTVQLLHLDANAGTSYFKPDADLVTSFQFQKAAGTNIMTIDSTNSRVGIGNAAPATALDVTGTITASTSVISPLVTTTGTVRLKGYTVATLPAGTAGDTAYVTDALAPAFLTAIVGGGAVVTPVFYDGTNWVSY